MLIGLVTAVTVHAWIFLPTAPLEWGFVPAEMWRHGGLTLVTSFFLHDGFLHLLGNMYFLGIFGDNVEDLLGWRRYFVLLLVATVAGNLFQAGAQMTPHIPGIGASGGIAGVIVCYGLMFPHSRLRLLQFARIVEISVWGALALWVGIQIVSMIVQRADGVGYAAHVGGAFAGLIFWSLNRGREPAGILSIAGRS
jgi:membrane associated rhomboid family serine protease